jgi:hypothetical protein
MLQSPSKLKMRKVHAVYKSVKKKLRLDVRSFLVKKCHRIIAAGFLVLHVSQKPMLSKCCVSDAHIIADLVKQTLLIHPFRMRRKKGINPFE